MLGPRTLRGGVMVVGHGLEGRQHIAPAPVARAHLLPSVVVGRQTPERYHAHHARAAAHDARLQEGDRRLALAIAGGQARPEVFAVDIGGGKDIADVGWYLARCGVPPGFDQQDAAGGVFRQPRRQRCACGPGPHHDNIGLTNVGLANIGMAYQAQVPGFGVAAKDTKVLALRGMRLPRQCYSAKIGWQVKTIIRSS